MSEPDRLAAIQHSHQESDCRCTPERHCCIGFLLELIKIKDEIIFEQFRQLTFERSRRLP